MTAFERTINALSVRAIPHVELDDDRRSKLRAIIQKKLKSGKDLVQTAPSTQRPSSEEEGDLDLLETIRKSLR